MKRVKVGDLVEWIADGDIGVVVEVDGKAFSVKWSEFKPEWYRRKKRIKNLRKIS